MIDEKLLQLTQTTYSKDKGVINLLDSITKYSFNQRKPLLMGKSESVEYQIVCPAIYHSKD